MNTTETDNTLRVFKIYIYGDRMAEASHSEGITRIALDYEHFINGDQGNDQACLSCDGADYLEEALKRKTGCSEIEWSH